MFSNVVSDIIPPDCAKKMEIISPKAFRLLVFACSTGLYCYFMRRNVDDQDSAVTHPAKTESTTSSSSALPSQEFFPPLPRVVTDILRASKLCYLATALEGEPHLSLMNFTYHQLEEVILMSTRRDTKKFALLEANPKVSLLIHDFPHIESQNQTGQTYSITMNGTAHVS